MKRNELDMLFDRLWPICRSITGPGIETSLEILKEYLPLNIKKIRTGEDIFDWTVPQEWELLSASLYSEDGALILSTENSNLHVLNFSDAFTGVVSYEELNRHLHSYQEMPDAIPYVTSYYKNRWGLCLSDAQRKTLDRSINYRVEIKARKYDGFLRYGEYFLQGNSEDLILITTYLCHPSMANNELSGPLAMLELFEKISTLENRHYSYLFLIWPETIGAIAFLATTEHKIIDRVVAGVVLTCLGGPSSTITFKHTRRDWIGRPSKLDELINSFVNRDANNFDQRAFSPTEGSDERQLCSPGINLPVVQAARTVYGQYREYHTNLDTKDFMQIDSVIDSANKIFLVLRAHELNRGFLVSNISGGEPMLSKRGLYPTLNSPLARKMSSDERLDEGAQLDLLLGSLSLMDGEHRLIDIANKLNVSYAAIVPLVEHLINVKLVAIKT